MNDGRVAGAAGAAGRHALGGEVAIDVTRELADPARALCDQLALVIDQLERHVGNSTGPTPYPWRSLEALRQDLGAAYRSAAHVARRLDELEHALMPAGEGVGAALDPAAAGWFEPAPAVDLGLRLASQHLVAGIELLVDLGATAVVRGDGGALALVVAQLVAECARSARSAAGSTLSVRVTADDAWVLVMIADNGAGSPRASALGDLVRGVLADSGALVEAASADGRGCVFELRLVARAGA